MTSTATRGLFTRGSVVRDPAKEYKGYTDDSGLYRPTIDEVEKQLESQWCGCGAKPGHNLRPSEVCDPHKVPRSMVMPGIGFGPHGFDTYLADSIPNICSDYPVMWNVADRDVQEDAMDPDMWGKPTSDTRHAGDPWLPMEVRYPGV